MSEVQQGGTGRPAAAAAPAPAPPAAATLTCSEWRHSAAHLPGGAQPEADGGRTRARYRYGPEGLAPKRPTGLIPQAEHGARRVRGDRRLRAVRGGVRVGQQGVHARGAGRRSLVLGGVPAAHARHRFHLRPRA